VKGDRIANAKRFGKGPKRTRVNSQITAEEVRVIDAENNQLGILKIPEALSQAEEVGLDLVEVAPGAEPPVCRIMDYGQFKYQQSKRLHEAKKHQKIIHLKEIKLRPKTETHDFQFKLKHAIQFMEDGDKVKVSVFFRGREMTHRENGKRLLEKFAEMTEEIAAIESPAKMEGRSMSMVLAPRKK